jgi:hypothetical protein
MAIFFNRPHPLSEFLNGLKPAPRAASGHVPGQPPPSIFYNPSAAGRTELCTRQPNQSPELARRDAMLWTLFIILLVLWLLGVVSSYTLGGFIHILLVLAVIALIFQLLSGRRTEI